MSQELLKTATKALSESGHEQRGARFTRERLMASLHERNKRKKSRFAVLLPLAAVFVGSTAFAAASGKLEEFVSSALTVAGLGPAEDSGVAPTTRHSTPGGATLARRASGSAAAVERAQAAAPESPAVVPSELPAPADVVANTAAEKSGQPDQVATGKSRLSEEARAHEVYRQAQHAQFKRGDLLAALSGYEKYLAMQPAGRFAVDARYNRALCLVRVGRAAEARHTLEEFAGGAFGGYRQADAADLLAALDQAR